MPENPFMSFSEGMNSGASWAHQQANLNIARDQVKLQQQHLDEFHNQFKIKQGERLFDLAQDAFSEVGPKMRKFKWDKLKSESQMLGINIDPSWDVAKDDPEYQPKIGEIFNMVKTPGKLDAEGVNNAYKGMADFLGTPATQEMFGKVLSGIQSYQQTMALKSAIMEKQQNFQAGENEKNRQTKETIADKQITATTNRFEQRQANQQTLNAQSQYDKGAKDLRFVMDSAARAQALIDKIRNPGNEEERLKSTKQLRTIIATEEARLVTGKGNFGEHTTANMQLDPYVSRLKDLWSNIKGEPEDTIPDSYLQQASQVYSELGEQYMQAHDRMASTLLGGATEAQKKAILGRASQFQKQFGAKFGGWKGEGVDDGQGGKTAEGKPPPYTGEQLRVAAGVWQAIQKGVNPKTGEPLSDAAKEKARQRLLQTYPQDVLKIIGAIE